MYLLHTVYTIICLNNPMLPFYNIVMDNKIHLFVPNTKKIAVACSAIHGQVSVCGCVWCLCRSIEQGVPSTGTLPMRGQWQGRAQERRRRTIDNEEEGRCEVMQNLLTEIECIKIKYVV